MIETVICKVSFSKFMNTMLIWFMICGFFFVELSEQATQNTNKRDELWHEFKGNDQVQTSLKGKDLEMNINKQIKGAFKNNHIVNINPNQNDLKENGIKGNNFMVNSHDFIGKEHNVLHPANVKSSIVHNPNVKKTGHEATKPKQAGSTTYTKILPVISQCFIIILIGYLAARLNFLGSTAANGLNQFVIKFSLPALIFYSVSTADLYLLKWVLIWSIFLGKFIIFFSVLILSYAFTKPRNKGTAGLYSLFCTQGNDLSVGLPLVAAIFDKHAEFINYIYLIDLCQYVLLDPIGFLLMELQRKKDKNDTQNFCKQLLDSLVSGILFNPNIIMTLLGVLANVIFEHNPPKVISQISEMLGKAFPGTGLFLLGYSLYGKCSVIRCNVLIPTILVTTKMFILSYLIKELVKGLNRSSQPPEKLSVLSDFGFMYGILPPSPSVFIFAIQFDMPTEVVATGLVLGTVISAPIIFIFASATILPIAKAVDFQRELVSTTLYASVISLKCTVCLIVGFICEKKWRRITHRITFFIILSQFFVAVGGILFSKLDLNKSFDFYFQFIINIGGRFGSLVWTTILVIFLTALRVRGLCFALKIRYYLFIYGLCCILFLIISLCLIKALTTGTNMETIIWSQFGDNEVSVILGVYLLVLIAVTVFLLIQRHSVITEKNRFENYKALHLSPNESSDSDSSGYSQTESKAQSGSSSPTPAPQTENSNHLRKIPDIEDFTSRRNKTSLEKRASFPIYCDQLFMCRAVQRARCVEKVHRYAANINSSLQEITVYDDEEGHQIVRHITLIILLSFCILATIAVYIWRLLLQKKNGVYMELEFLAIFFHYGQGIFTFIIFGFDLDFSTLVLWLKRKSERIFKFQGSNQEKLSLVPEKSKIICQQFAKYHFEKCFEELTSKENAKTKKKKNTFPGFQLVNWIMGAGLALDRNEAVKYCEHLFKGSLVQNVKRGKYFYDGPVLYKLNKGKLEDYVS